MSNFPPNTCTSHQGKPAPGLESMSTRLEDGPTPGECPTTGRNPGSDATMSRPTLEPKQKPLSSAIAACLPMPSATRLSSKSSSCKDATLVRKLSGTSAVGSTISVKGLNPYWEESCSTRSLALWLPTKTDLPVSDLSCIAGLSSSAVQNSWFSTTVFENPNESLSKTYCPSFMSSLADSTDCEITRAKRLKMLPTKEQRTLLNKWLGTYRFVYNETIWLLNLQIGILPNFMAIKKWLIPELVYEYPWTEECPYAIRSGAVAEACQCVKNAIAKFKKEGKFQHVSYKSRRDLKQSFFLRNDQWSKAQRGFNVSALGAMRFSEALPVNLRDGRVVKYGDKWYVALPVSNGRAVAENQGRLVALDPGVRSFQTYFSDQSAGHLGEQDFQRIVRLAVNLDNLLSERDRCQSKRRKAALQKASVRIRVKITNLIDEFHWKVARFLTDNFDVILLPTFEVSQMVSSACRKIRAKTVRSLLSWAHYKFSQRLEQKCFERGKKLIRVCEAYTSKTASWTGEVIANLGGAKTVKSGGKVVDRDLNGARGIFLRSLVDSPAIISGALLTVVSNG